jgi:hypothetical protein
VVRPRVAPSGPGAPKARRDPPRRADPLRRSEERPAPTHYLFDGSDRLDADSLQRRRSRARSADSTLTPSASQEGDSGAAPRRLQSLLIRGGGAPDFLVSLVAGGGEGPTPTVADVGRSAPKQSGERSATSKAAGRSGATPGSVGAKRAAPEQGSSGRSVKKARVRSKIQVLILGATIANSSTCFSS